MKKKWLKRSSAILLSLTMALSLFPGMKGTVPTVLAAGNKTPKSAYWTNVSGLKNFSLDETRDTEGRIIFGQNGSGAAQQWKIAGTDSRIDGDNIILFAASRLGISAFEDDDTNKSYDLNWNCTYPDGTTVSEVYPNHYGASDLRTVLNGYMSGNSYFSASEKTKMNQTTIYTDDQKNGTTYSVTDTLYAPYGVDNGKYVTVGTNTSDSLNDGVMINNSKFGNGVFWLRSPNYERDYGIAAVRGGVGVRRVGDSVYVVPAFDLNLSDVSFASAAEAATSTGYKANSYMTANTYTLRYESSGNEEAVISQDGTKIEVKGANGKYLMVQNNNGVYAMKIDSNNQTINASDIQMGSAESDKLANFNNCKVWLESTDEDRITTAKMARQDTAPPIDTVNVTGIIAPSAGSAFDTEAACATTGVSTTTPTVTWIQGGESVTGNAGYNTTYTTSVTLTAADGYEFASGVTATVNGQNATSVTKNADGTVTVTYTFTATAKAKLTSITAPTGITVANGTDYAAMGLPTNVAIVTEGNTETTAEVTWNTTTPASGSYDPKLSTEQTVTLNGTVACPSNIDQNGVTLTTTITVKISAAGIVGALTFAPTEGTYTENQTVTLSSSTNGATIHYTTDGTTPTTDSNVYTAAIPVTGTAGQSISTTIKAIAVKSGMQTSSVTSATYVIELPAPVPTPTCINSVAVTDIVAPVTGEPLDTTASCSATGISNKAPTVTWTPADTTAAYNTTYTASVTLTPATNYGFASNVTATVNGQNATSVTKNADGTVTVTYTFTATAKAKLTSITAPTGITVANGTDYAAMGLPTNVAIVTEGNTETTAAVTWNTTTPASGSYNPTLTTEQTVTLNGTVTCPNSVDANGVALTTTITITIRAAGAIPTTPGTTTPSQPKPENPTPAQPTPEQPKPEEPKPEEPKPEKPQKPDKPQETQKPKVEVLPAKASVTDNRQVTLTWDKVDGAEGYRIYRKVKGSKDGYQRVATTRNLQLVQKQLDNKKTYQYYIVAYKTIDGKKARIGKTLTLYAVMNNVKYTEVKKIKLNKKSYSLEVGAKAKIKAVLLKRENKKKIKAESEKLRFCSTDNTVAKVNASGTITAKGAGTCYIYVVAGNGISQKIKVTVSKEK